MTTKLRARLIGAWQLESFSFDPVDGSDAMPPLGPRPTGLLVYTESGFMSAQISGANRPKVASGDWSQAAPREYAALASSYIAYAGPFEVDEDSRSVTHFVDMSLIPFWVGVPQQRLARLDRDHLYLTTGQPLLFNGKLGHASLKWRRADTA